MAIRNIYVEGEEVLRKISKPVTEFNQKLWILLDDMAETMNQADGVGLAAPQVGILKRVVVIDVGEGLIELINPKIIGQKGSQIEAEGCLSCPGEYGKVKRPSWVSVQAQDRHGNEIVREGTGLLAVAFCHEIDHLDGKIFKDIAIEMLDVKSEE